MYIVGGRILTMAGREIPEGILQIRNGKIAQVGARGEVKLQPEEGEQVVIAKNALIMPGIIEAHCHMGIMEEKKSTEGDDCNETVDPLTPALRAIDGINPMDAAFDDAVRAGITAAMIGPGSSNVVGGQFAMVKTKGRRIDDLILKSPAAMKVAFGENPRSIIPGRTKVLSLVWPSPPCCAGNSGRAENICGKSRKRRRRESILHRILKKSAIFRYCGETSR